MNEDHVLIDERIRSLTADQERISQQVEKHEEDFSNFLVRQADTFAEFRLELLREIRAIERSIASKCEQDSAIIATQNRELMRADRVESATTETAKALAVVAASMETLKSDTDKSLTAAHVAIRGHGARIEKLERKGGRVALKVLAGAGGVAGTALITYLMAKALGGAP